MRQRRTPGAGIVLAFLASVASGASAGEPRPAEAAPTPISLREALELARSTSPKLGSLAAREDAAAAGLDAEQGTRRPVLDVAVGYQRRSHVEDFIIRPAGALSPPVNVYPDIPDRFRSQVGLMVPSTPAAGCPRGSRRRSIRSRPPGVMSIPASPTSTSRRPSHTGTSSRRASARGWSRLPSSRTTRT